MDSISKRIAHNRIKKPLYHYFGNLEPDSIRLLLEKFETSEETLQNAMALREKQGLNDGYENYLQDYHQYDVQFKNTNTNFNDERDYEMFLDFFKPALQDIVDKLSATIFRTRYATIEKDDILAWHVDQPHYDRFVIVLDGEHTFEIKHRKKIEPQVMKPGEIWFINQSWEHRVINTGNKRRLALLGCFEYNVK